MSKTKLWLYYIYAFKYWNKSTYVESLLKWDETSLFTDIIPVGISQRKKCFETLLRALQTSFFVMYVWIMEFQLMTLTGPCWFSSIIWYCISSKRKWCSAGRTSWIISPTRRKWIRRTGWWSSVKTILTCNDYLLLVLIEYFCKIQVLIVICKQCFFQLI